MVNVRWLRKTLLACLTIKKYYRYKICINEYFILISKLEQCLTCTVRPPGWLWSPTAREWTSTRPCTRRVLRNHTSEHFNYDAVFRVSVNLSAIFHKRMWIFFICLKAFKKIIFLTEKYTYHFGHFRSFIILLKI